MKKSVNERKVNKKHPGIDQTWKDKNSFSNRI